MTIPICLSPLKFYDKLSKQSHRKSYAFGNISPLIAKLHSIPSFQFVLPANIQNATLKEAHLYNAKSDNVNVSYIEESLNETGFSIKRYGNYDIAIYLGNLPIQKINYEGIYYLKLIFTNNINEAEFYSEVFCLTNNTDDCLEIEYWNESNNFNTKGGLVVFPKQFHFKLLLKTEIGKPEYAFEEESTKRLGYTFVESQVSKKIYKFNAIVPEFICDAMRLIRLCDNKIIRSRDDEYEAITFEMEPEWQTQGDLASVTCEFETDNVIVNLGGFMPERHTNGDFNDDFNDDFNND